MTGEGEDHPGCDSLGTSSILDADQSSGKIGSVLATLDGSCRPPIAGLVFCNESGSCTLKSLIPSLDGIRLLETSQEGAFSYDNLIALRINTLSIIFDW